MFWLEEYLNDNSQIKKKEPFVGILHPKISPSNSETKITWFSIYIESLAFKISQVQACGWESQVVFSACESQLMKPNTKKNKDKWKSSEAELHTYTCMQ